jgi:hypothetical protein
MLGTPAAEEKAVTEETDSSHSGDSRVETTAVRTRRQKVRKRQETTGTSGDANSRERTATAVGAAATQRL